jgi:hypothetical protein
LLAFLEDSSGINTAGNGIGHDLMAVLDGNTANSIVLNEYYNAELDNYRKGSVRYEMYDIDDGVHNLTFRAWDVLNNYNEATLNFEVVNSDKCEINFFGNYPNPFKDKTNFIFKHNHPGENMNIRLNIYDLTGRLVFSQVQENVYEGFTAGPIVWEGVDNFGNKLNSGMFIAELEVLFEKSGVSTSIRKKIILLR